MDCIVETSSGAAQRGYYYLCIKKTLEFLVLVSVFSSLYSYLSSFHFFFSYNLQLSTLIFPLFARVLDRKYMFLICNGILAFLSKSLNHGGGRFMKSDEDGVKQKITVMSSRLEEYANSPPNVAAEEEEDQTAQWGDDYGDLHNGYEEMKITSVILESQKWEEEEEEDDHEVEEEEEVDNEVKENGALDSSISPMDEVNDASVSTEELNKKFEEFINKMKEEIKIEAQQ